MCTGPVGLAVLCLCGLLASETAYAQSFREALGTNSRRKDPVELQNRYPLIREYHLWVDDQGYDQDKVPNWPANPFTLGPTDTYYERLRQAVVPVAYGLPGEMRGIKAPNVALGIPFDLDMVSQKPYLPVDGPGADAGFELGLSKFIQSGPQAGTYFGDWLATQSPAADEPAAWLLKAHWMTVLADRYAQSTLQWWQRYTLVRPSADAAPYVEDNPAAAGRVQWFEAENEPDRNWLDPDEMPDAETMWRHSPAQLAAQTSMVYDGHGRSSAAQWPYVAPGAPQYERSIYLGVTNASPSAKVSIAGLAGLRGGFVEGMIDWFATNRQPGVFGFGHGVYGSIPQPPKLPFDAVSFHHYAASNSLDRNEEYSNYKKGQWNPTEVGAVGESPERHALRERMEHVIDELYSYISVNYPALYGEMTDKEVWLSEFGYDSDNFQVGDLIGNGTLTATGGIQIPFIPDVNDPSRMLDRELVQAQWLARSYLELMAVRATVPTLSDGREQKRVDRFMQYELLDPKPMSQAGPGTQQFQTVGLYDNGGRPKVAHWFTQSLLYYIGEYRHTVGNGDPEDTKVQAFPDTYGHLAIAPSPGQTVAIPTADNLVPVAYKYARAFGTGHDERFVIWSPTQQGYAYDVDIDLMQLYGGQFGNHTTATVFRLSDLSVRGIPTEYAITSGKITGVRVDETPMILQLGAAGATTDVAPVSNVLVTNLCCGDVRVTWSRADPRLTNRYHIGYLPVAQVTGDFIAPREVTFVAYDYTGTSITLSGLDETESYYVVILPINAGGFGADLSLGIPVAPPDGSRPDIEFLHLVPAPRTCTAETECVLGVQPAWLTSLPANLPEASKLATIFSGGPGADGLKCDDAVVQEAAWGYIATAPGTQHQTVITFPQAVDIDYLKVHTGGFDTTASTAIAFEVEDCDCPGLWQPYFQIPGVSEYDLWSINVRPRRRVKRLRVTKGAVNLHAVILCTRPSSCGPRGFRPDEGPFASVDVVGNDFARVSWAPAIDTAAVEPVQGYTLALASALTDDNELASPVLYDVDARYGADLAKTLSDLDPGATYYGRLVPTIGVCVSHTPSQFEPLTYDPADGAAFTFTTGNTQENFGRSGSAPAQSALATDITRVYPNPARHTLQVEAGAPLGRIRFYDALGRLVREEHGGGAMQHTVSLTALPTGSYHVHVEREDRSDTFVVFVE